MTFASPGYLLLLGILPILWYLGRFKRRNEPAVQYSHLAPLRGLANRQAAIWQQMRDFMRLGTLGLLILALARPQQGLESGERDIHATDILLCLDVSQSMQAEDFKPKNRITVAKESALNFIQKRRHDRIGLVVFAEAAMTQCPLTVDHDALGGMLAGIQIGTLPAGRTAIGDGLAICVERLKSTPAKGKVIVLLTDGVNNAGIVDPLTAAKAARSFGIKIYAIGAASPKGGFITMQDPIFGSRRVKIADSLDEETLTKVATATGGRYFRANDAQGLKAIFDEIDKLEKTEIKVKTFTEYLERFEWLLLPGLLLIGFELGFGQLIFRGLP